MLLFFIATAWLIFVLYFLYVIGKIYFTRELLTPFSKPDGLKLPFLTVIIPARNEASNIERCVDSLLNQSYPDDRYKIIVVDDDSEDNTAAIVRKIQADHPHLNLAEAGELPEGWTGKNNACWKGAAIAEGEWYCFVDADTIAAPDLLGTTVAFAATHHIDMLSLNPFQELISISERLLLPAVFISIAASMNFTRVNDPSRPEALANGQFILFRQSVYKAMNGHSAVRGEIMDDIALAKVVKQSGYRLYWMFGDELIRTRMYQSFSDIWEGFSKNLGDIMRDDSALTSAFTAFKSLLLGWMPVMLPFLTGHGLSTGKGSMLAYWTFGLSVLGTAAIFVFCLLTIKALKIPFGYVLSSPLGFTMHSLLTLNSLWNRVKGERKWKGRRYH
ncbi:glycosyltransferase [Thermodesulfobacteriota bacterium]